MRRTIQLDDELVVELRKRSDEENVSFTKMINQMIRRGFEASKRDKKTTRRYREREFSMGVPTIDLGKAMALTSSLEDGESFGKHLGANEEDL